MKLVKKQMSKKIDVAEEKKEPMKERPSSVKPIIFFLRMLIHLSFQKMFIRV